MDVEDGEPETEDRGVMLPLCGIKLEKGSVCVVESCVICGEVEGSGGMGGREGWL